MLDTVLGFLFNLVFEVIGFHVGRFCLKILTLGRFNSKTDSHHQGWVSLVGLLVIFILVMSFGVWLNN
jgi:hypothetical protein